MKCFTLSFNWTKNLLMLYLKLLQAVFDVIQDFTAVLFYFPRGVFKVLSNDTTTASSQLVWKI